VFLVTVFTALLGSGFQRWTYPFLWVPELSLSSATSFSQLSACRLSLSSLFCRLSTQTVFELTGNRSVRVRVTLRLTVTGPHSITLARTAQIKPLATAHIVACLSVGVFSRRLLSHCLVTGVFTESFPSNDCLCWLHNSGFQRNSHSILCYALDMCAKNKMQLKFDLWVMCS
jgi:hypothetical protein